VPEDALQQKLDLDALEIGLEGRPFGLSYGLRSLSYL
jgi:hypothetical protein